MATYSCTETRYHADSNLKGRRTTDMPQFNRYNGIDYSGAETADSSCKGIRVFMAEGSGTPEQVQPRR